MNYSKGEWVIRSGFKITVGEEQKWIANCYPFHEKLPRPTIFEAEANAQLIKAAPDLYEACKYATRLVSAEETSDADWISLLFELKQALAKAEGK